MLESGHKENLTARWRAASLVVLGTTSEVRPLSDPHERPKGAPWALASLRVEQVLKGDSKTEYVTLLGPRYSSRHVPMLPPLKPGVRAIFFLQPAPQTAIAAAKPPQSPEGLLVIATTADIQPPERLATVVQIGAELEK